MGGMGNVLPIAGSGFVSHEGIDFLEEKWLFVPMILMEHRPTDGEEEEKSGEEDGGLAAHEKSG